MNSFEMNLVAAVSILMLVVGWVYATKFICDRIETANSTHSDIVVDIGLTVLVAASFLICFLLEAFVVAAVVLVLVVLEILRRFEPETP
ncbi:hypothetical protein HY628_00365 [Candidatus Uhrbacteria bacterium]|nr:hypothetical protein [Candidatus Uhrbacteria bacterium]